MAPYERRERCTKCGFDKEKLYKCSGCKGATARYCGRECQKEHWQIHKPICRPAQPNEIWGIKILPNQGGCLYGTADVPGGDGQDRSKLFEHVLIKADHPVFSEGELCPVSVAVGMPLILYSAAVNGMQVRARDQGNQAAVFLRIEPENAIAPLPCTIFPAADCLLLQCIIVRHDRRPLTREAIEAMWQFTAKVINGAGYPTSDGWVPVRSLVTTAYWQVFSRDYYKEQKGKGRAGFDEFWEPL
ncbi:hypothetical protein GLOTRDRAFT_38618 [Gloeophyllum trabeum ATCC 11539]|uniref:MYND-type domain-containing protein n=1 Tax=Gloeophyllum trabeum (strain ATCC 11539 / FP-39264 / Madison 617) TaxID=670483 RepID=S7RV73_GLOTA|nr:uncharacterized protein GLOTRDRAFT_38618 [Gloeophyllum trabeum ATCC 11539]EPQ57124.1 hypothetical protein GLOTRDRAFT_38618 [Gloeophyllum trabeum ATCC 11539]